MRRVTDSDQVLVTARIKEAAATSAVSLQTYRPVHQSSANPVGGSRPTAARPATAALRQEWPYRVGHDTLDQDGFACRLRYSS
jgi:hypothetical protein